MEKLNRMECWRKTLTGLVLPLVSCGIISASIVLGFSTYKEKHRRPIEKQEKINLPPNNNLNLGQRKNFWFGYPDVRYCGFLDEKTFALSIYDGVTEVELFYPSGTKEVYFGDRRYHFEVISATPSNLEFKLIKECN